MKKRLPQTKQSGAPAPKPLYVVRLSPLPEKQLDKLPDIPVERITKALAKLATDPCPSGVKKLKGREEYRVRVGDYRVLYSIFDAVLLVEVVKVGVRGNFYDE